MCANKIRKLSGKKGIFAVALVFTFAIIILITISVLIGMSWSKGRLFANRLKRFQAINYTEAGLFEAINRFRVKYNDGVVLWDINDPFWDTKTNSRGIEIEPGINVNIFVDKTDPAGKNKIKAKLYY
jgi:hypothetical protein